MAELTLILGTIAGMGAGWLGHLVRGWLRHRHGAP